jgi:hypothetical protein
MANGNRHPYGGDVDPLADLKRFVRDVRFLSGWLLVAAVNAGIIAVVGAVGPPWPSQKGIAMATAVIQFAAYAWCFVFYLRSSGGLAIGRIETRLKFGLVFFIVVLIIYVIVYSTLVLDIDGVGTEARGFRYTDWARQYLTDHPGATDQDLVKESSGNIEQIFTPRSLAAARIAVLLSWLSVFYTLAYSLCVLVVHQYRQAQSQSRNKEKKGTGFNTL